MSYGPQKHLRDAPLGTGPMDQKKTGAPRPKPMVEACEVRNRLLEAFQPASRARIEPHIQPMNLKLGAAVCEAGGFLEHVYFPRGAVLSR